MKTKIQIAADCIKESDCYSEAWFVDKALKYLAKNYGALIIEYSDSEWNISIGVCRKSGISLSNTLAETIFELTDFKT